MPIVWYIQQLLSEHVDSMFVTVALDANDICLLRHLRLPLPWLWIGLLLGIGLGGLVHWHVYRGHHQQDAILSLYTARVRIRNASDASLLRIEIHSKVVLTALWKFTGDWDPFKGSLVLSKMHSKLLSAALSRLALTTCSFTPEQTGILATKNSILHITQRYPTQPIH